MNLSIKSIPQTQPILQPWALPDTTCRWYSRPSALDALASSFEPISLEQMEAVALLNRTDTKFAMSTGQLLSALQGLQGDYWMLSVNGNRLNHYRTQYFDTPDFELYHLHVNGRADRYKVRSREYTDSHRAFLEVKHKNSKERTIKERIPTAQPVVEMSEDTENWLNGVFPYDSRALEPKLWNTFTRLTLVSKAYCERVTLDLDLTFYKGETLAQLSGIAIAELKMDANNRASPFMAQMRLQRIHPRGFSKYCIGVSLLYDDVKKNALKPRLLWVEKMTAGGISYE